MFSSAAEREEPFRTVSHMTLFVGPFTDPSSFSDAALEHRTLSRVYVTTVNRLMIYTVTKMLVRFHLTSATYSCPRYSTTLLDRRCLQL